MESEPMYTVSEVAGRLRLHEQTVREWLREGKLYGVRLGGTKAGWRIPGSSVDALLASASRVPVASSSQKQARARSQLRGLAEANRARGDVAGAARIEAQLAAMADGDTLDERPTQECPASGSGSGARPT